MADSEHKHDSHKTSADMQSHTANHAAHSDHAGHDMSEHSRHGIDTSQADQMADHSR
jgi:hypothetical protein